MGGALVWPRKANQITVTAITVAAMPSIDQGFGGDMELERRFGHGSVSTTLPRHTRIPLAYKMPLIIPDSAAGKRNCSALDQKEKTHLARWPADGEK